MARRTFSGVAGTGSRPSCEALIEKLDHLERVVGLELSQGPLDGVLGLGDGLAVHAAGAVEDEDHLHGGALDAA